MLNNIIIGFSSVAFGSTLWKESSGVGGLYIVVIVLWLLIGFFLFIYSTLIGKSSSENKHNE